MKTENNLISGSELADLLDVSRAAISQAVKRGNDCKGYSISEYAEHDEGGRLTGFSKDLIDVIKSVRENPHVEKFSIHNIDKHAEQKEYKSHREGKNEKSKTREYTPKFLHGEDVKAAMNFLPQTVESVQKLQSHQQDAIYASIIGAGFSAIGYVVGGENKGLFALIFGVLGIGIYATSKHYHDKLNSQSLAGIDTQKETQNSKKETKEFANKIIGYVPTNSANDADKFTSNKKTEEL